VTEFSLEPQDSEALPERGESLPQRGVPLPQRRPSPERGEPLPKRGEQLPQRGEPLPQRDAALPQRGQPLPKRGEPLPQRGETLPKRGEPLPQRDAALPQRGQPLPQRDQPPAQPGEPLPQREPGPAVSGFLPRRVSRARPGRHRSPHRLSVASDAPALVLAVPGTAEADSAQIGNEVATIAGLSCPGVDIRVGYLDGDTLSLSDCLAQGTTESADEDLGTVLVPLLMNPVPRVDAVLGKLAAERPERTVLAAHLGPHPLVAEAVHARLAEAGLARHARSTGLSIAADGRGIVVLADKGDEAMNAASVVAVLLASRLSVPVMPASLGDASSIVDAVTRLSESGAPRPVLAPCLIGPETSQDVFDDISAALGTPCAPLIGAHQAVGQLVAIRYGAALASLTMAG
jgi:sirohydrochlorin ferrochelatase